MKTTTHSSILLGFGLEALAAFDGEGDSVRADLVNRMLGWLDLEYTGLEDGGIHLPKSFGFSGAYPNPFNPQITLNYTVVSQSQVSIIIYDLKGQEVKTLVQEQHGAGRYTLSWDGLSEEQQQVSTGVYFARIMDGTASDVLKMVYLR